MEDKPSKDAAVEKIEAERGERVVPFAQKNDRDKLRCVLDEWVYDDQRPLIGCLHGHGGANR